MTRDLISEYPYYGSIKRIVEGQHTDLEVTIYEGAMDEHMATDEEGSTMQTSGYIISIPLTKDENGVWIVPRKGDEITISRYGETFTLMVDNSEPSQLGGVSIHATRNSWD